MKNHRHLCWIVRVTTMFLTGVIPATIVLISIVLMMPIAGRFLDWLLVMAMLAVLGIAGLWGATFQDGQERILPNSVTTALVFCGLIGAVPFFFGFLNDALDGGDLSLLMAILLLGPICCSAYFLLERLVALLRGRVGASNKSLKGDVAKATRP